jgi:hypothetical protein
MPETNFTITTDLSNTGYTDAGSWISLTIPGAGFVLNQVEIERADGQRFSYQVAPTFALPILDPVREITRQGNTYTVYVGETIPCYDRTVIWHLETDCCDYHEGSNFLTFNYGALNWIDDLFIDALGNFIGPANVPFLGSETVEVIVSTTAAQTVDIPLCPGLNYIALPLASTGILTEADLLASINASGCNADAIFVFDCAYATFTSFTWLDDGPGDPVYPGQAFFVNITDPTPCTWSVTGVPPSSISYGLCTGPNAVSIPVYSTSLMNASDLLASVPNANAVYEFTKVNGNCGAAPGFNAYYPFSTPAEDFALVPGIYAYWVNTSAPGTWNPPNP